MPFIPGSRHRAAPGAWTQDAEEAGGAEAQPETVGAKWKVGILLGGAASTERRQGRALTLEGASAILVRGVRRGSWFDFPEGGAASKDQGQGCGT